MEVEVAFQGTNVSVSSITDSTMSVTVGSGGIYGWARNKNGTSGGNSSIENPIAIGGGGGSKFRNQCKRSGLTGFSGGGYGMNQTLITQVEQLVREMRQK